MTWDGHSFKGSPLFELVHDLEAGKYPMLDPMYDPNVAREQVIAIQSDVDQSVAEGRIGQSYSAIIHGQSSAFDSHAFPCLLRCKACGAELGFVPSLMVAHEHANAHLRAKHPELQAVFPIEEHD